MSRKGDLLGKPMEDSKIKIDQLSRTRHDFFYMQLVTRHYITYRKILKEFTGPTYHDPLMNLKDKIEAIGIESIGKEEMEELDAEKILKDYTRLLFNLKSTSCIIIVFSALCLESLINDYCVLNKSGRFLKNYIDKLDTPSKWLIVPKLITNKEIPTDSQAFELLKELFILRNELVHPKSKQSESQELVKDMVQLYIKQTNKSFITIKEATHELYKIDSSFSYLNDYKWLWDTSERFKDISEIESLLNTFMGQQIS